MSKRHVALFVFVFAVLLVGRLWIAGTGYLEDQDEFLYIWIHKNFSDFTHLSTWVKCITHMQGQPPEILARLLEYITVIPVASCMGKQMLHPDVLYFIGLYNILVSLLILYVFFRVLTKLGFSTTLGLAGTLLLGTLFNFNMYTRHILPYDQAFLFQMLALNLLLRDKLKPGTILMAGLLSATGLTNYLGCFMFVFIIGGLLVIGDYKRPALAAKKGLLFALPFVLLVLCYEIIMRVNGKSYIGFLTGYYGTLNNGGSFDEGIVYVFLYFYLVEKWWGMVLLLLFFAGSSLLFKNGDSVKTKRLVALGIFGYLVYGGYVFLFKRMVFEGRILHIYYPFIIIGVLTLLQQQKAVRQKYMVVAIMFFAVINYGFVINDFNSIGYPRNAVYRYGLFEDKGKTEFTYFEDITPCIYYSGRLKYFIDSVGKSILPPGQYILNNICFLPDVSDDSLVEHYKPLQISANDSVVFEQLHFESHPAYTLEYCSRYSREFYLKNQVKIRVIKTALR